MRQPLMMHPSHFSHPFSTKPWAGRKVSQEHQPQPVAITTFMQGFKNRPRDQYCTSKLVDAMGIIRGKLGGENFKVVGVENLNDFLSKKAWGKGCDPSDVVPYAFKLAKHIEKQRNKHLGANRVDISVQGECVTMQWFRQ
jgi:hypothetical protein